MSVTTTSLRRCRFVHWNAFNSICRASLAALPRRMQIILEKTTDAIHARVSRYTPRHTHTHSRGIAISGSSLIESRAETCHIPFIISIARALNSPPVTTGEYNTSDNGVSRGSTSVRRRRIGEGRGGLRKRRLIVRI